MSRIADFDTADEALLADMGAVAPTAPGAGTEMLGATVAAQSR